ncbi:MAG: TSUP family transporter [Gammaproteobacteria bacterium]
MEFVLVPPELTPVGALGLLVASFITSAMTAGVGIGGGVALISVMASVLPPAVVLPAHGVVQLGSNAGRAFVMRANVDWAIVAPFAAGSVAGVALASPLVVALPQDALQLILAAFVLYSVWAPKPKGLAVRGAGYSVVGTVSSFCTMFVGGTGVLVAAFWSPQRMGRQGLVATHAACMTLQHGFKVIAFGLLGFQFAGWAAMLAAMIGSGFLGTLVGKAVLDRIPQAAFARAFRLVLTALALRLLWLGVSGLL